MKKGESKKTKKPRKRETKEISLDNGRYKFIRKGNTVYCDAEGERRHFMGDRPISFLFNECIRLKESKSGKVDIPKIIADLNIRCSCEESLYDQTEVVQDEDETKIVIEPCLKCLENARNTNVDEDLGLTED